MSECARCGEGESVPGKLGSRCRDCIGELLEDVDDDPELTLVLSSAVGPTRRLRIRRSGEPGVPFALEEAEWTGCAWRPVGHEPLDSVEIDGDAYHATGHVEDGP